MTIGFPALDGQGTGVRELCRNRDSFLPEMAYRQRGDRICRHWTVALGKFTVASGVDLSSQYCD